MYKDAHPLLLSLTKKESNDEEVRTKHAGDGNGDLCEEEKHDATNPISCALGGDCWPGLLEWMQQYANVIQQWRKLLGWQCELPRRTQPLSKLER